MALTADSPLCPNIITVLYCCCTYYGPVFPADLCLYKRRKFSVHGTVSYVVFQNIPGYDVLRRYTMDRFLPPPTYYAYYRKHGKPYKTSMLILERKGLLYILKQYCNSGENGTAVHTKTSMLLVEITCMLYIGNHNLKVPESLSLRKIQH